MNSIFFDFAENFQSVQIFYDAVSSNLQQQQSVAPCAPESFRPDAGSNMRNEAKMQSNGRRRMNNEGPFKQHLKLCRQNAFIDLASAEIRLIALAKFGMQLNKEPDQLHLTVENLIMKHQVLSILKQKLFPTMEDYLAGGKVIIQMSNTLQHVLRRLNQMQNRKGVFESNELKDMLKIFLWHNRMLCPEFDRYIDKYWDDIMTLVLVNQGLMQDLPENNNMVEKDRQNQSFFAEEQYEVQSYKQESQCQIQEKNNKKQTKKKSIKKSKKTNSKKNSLKSKKQKNKRNSNQQIQDDQTYLAYQIASYFYYITIKQKFQIILQ